MPAINQFRQLKAPNGASNVNFTQLGLNAAMRSVEEKLQDVVSVKDFGAVGNGIANDTVAIQAAINAAQAKGGGAVYFPTGNYVITSTLVITGNEIVLRGDGIGATFIYTYVLNSDSVHFSGTASTPLQRVGMSDMAIYCVAMNPTAGALVRMTNCNTLANFVNVELAAGYGALLLESVVHGYFTNVNLTGDANMTSHQAGSYLCKISQASGGALPAEIHFYGSEWRGQQGNNFLDHALVVTAADGVWFNGGHFGFCRKSAILFSPETTTSQITAVNFSLIYVDTVNFDSSSVGFSIESPIGYTGIFGAHDINIAQIYNCYRGLRHNCPTTDFSKIQIAQALSIETDAVQITLGDKLTVRLDAAWDINKAASNGCGIFVQGSGKDYVFSANVQKRGTSIPQAAIWLDGTINDILIENVSAKDCTFDVIRSNTTGTNIIIGASQTNRSRAITADGGGGIPVVLSQTLFYVGGVNNVGIISDQFCVAGRTITLVFTASISVFDTNNLKLNGNFVASADDTLTLTCDGVNWYEVARSAN